MNVRTQWQWWRVVVPLVFCISASLFVYGQEELGKKEGRDWIGGSFESGFDFSRSDNDTDLDFRQTLRLRIDEPNENKIHFRSLVWLNEDLNGDETSTSALRDINNASSSNVRVRILQLYVQFDDLWGDSALRIGRQRILDGFTFNRIDGLHFKWNNKQWEWYAFGGARASIYQDAHEDLSFGAGVNYRANRKTRVAFNAFYGEDRRNSRDVVFRGFLTELLNLDFPRGVDRTVEETAAALSIWHDFTPNFRAYGRYLWKDEEGDELTLSANAYVPSWDVSVELYLDAQFGDSEDEVNDLTNFFRILGARDDFYNLFLAVHLPLTKNTMISLELEIHDSEDDDPLSGNRDFERYAVIVSTDDLFKGVDASFTFERWDAHDAEGVWTLTGEFRKKWEQVTLAVGADFERYEDRFVEYNSTPFILDQLRIMLIPGQFPSFNPLIDLFDTQIVENHENIYSGFARVRYTLDEQQEFNARLSVESDDGPDSPYWRLQADYTLRF